MFQRLVSFKKSVVLVIITVVVILFYNTLTVLLVSWYDYNFFNTPVGSYKIPQNGLRQKPILTLFTSFKDISQRQKINENTIKSWSSLPGVIPVMYIEPNDPPFLAKLAQSHGWIVYEAPRLHQGYPVLKSMFLHALAHVKPVTYFIGYANSDILFTSSLVHTLEYLSKLNTSLVTETGIFVTGRRINTLINDIQFDYESGLLKKIDDKDPKYIVREEGNALDFFIFTRTQFGWEEIPDFVIGKPGFDPWLSLQAKTLGMFTVDVTLSVVAVHQILSSTATDKGWLSKNVCMNRDFIDPFDSRPGHTHCMDYFTDLTSYSQHGLSALYMRLYRRNYFAYGCNPYFRRRSICRDLAKEKLTESETYVINHFL